MKKIIKQSFFYILLFSLNSCIGLSSEYLLGKPIDKARKLILSKKVCDFNDIRKRTDFNSDEYSQKFRAYGSFVDVYGGLFGIFATYPNGLWMFASFLYIPLSIISYRVSEGESFVVEKESFGASHWYSKNKTCDNNQDYYFHQVEILIELDSSIKENLQIEKTTSKEQLNSICQYKTDEYDKELFSTLENNVLEYNKDYPYNSKNIFIRNKTVRKQLFFEKTLLESKFESDYKMVPSKSGKSEYKDRKQLSCKMEYLIYYQGGSYRFKKDYFDYGQKKNLQ